MLLSFLEGLEHYPAGPRLWLVTSRAPPCSSTMQQRAPDVRSAQAELPVDFLGACRSSCAVSLQVQAVHQAQQQASGRSVVNRKENWVFFLLKLNRKEWDLVFFLWISFSYWSSTGRSETWVFFIEKVVFWSTMSIPCKLTWLKTGQNHLWNWLRVQKQTVLTVPKVPGFGVEGSKSDFNDSWMVKNGLLPYTPSIHSIQNFGYCDLSNQMVYIYFSLTQL